MTGPAAYTRMPGTDGLYARDCQQCGRFPANELTNFTFGKDPWQSKAPLGPEVLL